MDVQKIIYVAVPIIVLVIVVAAVMTVARTGKTTFSDANSDLTSSLGSMSTGAYDLYDGAEVNGGTVIDVINETWKDQNVEVLVSTKDPATPGTAVNIVYNRDGAGTTPTGDASWRQGAEPVDSELQNTPATLAGGLAMGNATINVCKKYGATTAEGDTLGTAYSNGYYKNPNASTPGFISQSTLFVGSVQTDTNGDVRRITFVQK